MGTEFVHKVKKTADFEGNQRFFNAAGKPFGGLKIQASNMAF